MSDERVKPALTPEEWAETREKWHSGPSRLISSDDRCEGGCRIDDADRHALAALCLHGQDFGFTREDAELLRGLKQYAHPEALRVVFGEHVANRLASLADRIEALLPPEQTPPT